jgi:hypothetical protein
MIDPDPLWYFAEGLSSLFGAAEHFAHNRFDHGNIQLDKLLDKQPKPQQNNNRSC